jgi:hypothetical protein
LVALAGAASYFCAFFAVDNIDSRARASRRHFFIWRRLLRPNTSQRRSLDHMPGECPFGSWSFCPWPAGWLVFLEYTHANRKKKKREQSGISLPCAAKRFYFTGVLLHRQTPRRAYFVFFSCVIVATVVGMNTLPQEVLQMIVSGCDSRSLVALLTVSRQMRWLSACALIDGWHGAGRGRGVLTFLPPNDTLGGDDNAEHNADNRAQLVHAINLILACKAERLACVLRDDRKRFEHDITDREYPEVYSFLRYRLPSLLRGKVARVDLCLNRATLRRFLHDLAGRFGVLHKTVNRYPRWMYFWHEGSVCVLGRGHMIFSLPATPAAPSGCFHCPTEFSWC